MRSGSPAISCPPGGCLVFPPGSSPPSGPRGSSWQSWAPSEQPADPLLLPGPAGPTYTSDPCSVCLLASAGETRGRSDGPVIPPPDTFLSFSLDNCLGPSDPLSPCRGQNQHWLSTAVEQPTIYWLGTRVPITSPGVPHWSVILSGTLTQVKGKLMMSHEKMKGQGKICGLCF